MEELKQQIERITVKYAECVEKTLDAEMKKEEALTIEQLLELGSGFSLLNHATATLERIGRLLKTSGHMES